MEEESGQSGLTEVGMDTSLHAGKKKRMVAIFIGLLDDSPGPGQLRLYLTEERSEFIEVEQSDEIVRKAHYDMVHTVIWVNADANVIHAASANAQAGFLSGEIARNVQFTQDFQSLGQRITWEDYARTMVATMITNEEKCPQATNAAQWCPH